MSSYFFRWYDLRKYLWEPNQVDVNHLWAEPFLNFTLRNNSYNVIRLPQVRACTAPVVCIFTLSGQPCSLLFCFHTHPAQNAPFSASLAQVLNYTEFDEIDKPGNYLGDDATRRRRLVAANSRPRMSSAADLADYLNSKLRGAGDSVAADTVMRWLDEALLPVQEGDRGDAEESKAASVIDEEGHSS